MLPVVLLGVKARLRTDIQSFTPEIVSRTALELPGELVTQRFFFTHSTDTHLPPVHLHKESAPDDKRSFRSNLVPVRKHLFGHTRRAGRCKKLTKTHLECTLVTISPPGLQLIESAKSQDQFTDLFLSRQSITTLPPRMTLPSHNLHGRSLIQHILATEEDRLSQWYTIKTRAYI